MKIEKIQICILFLSITVLTSTAQESLNERVGVCITPANISVLQKAGCNYIEIGIYRSLVPNQLDSIFTNHLNEFNTFNFPANAGNAFFLAEIKLVGEHVDPDLITQYAETAMMRANQAGVHTIVLGSGKARTIPEHDDPIQVKNQFVELCRKLAGLASKYQIHIRIEPLRKEANFINTVRQRVENSS